MPLPPAAIELELETTPLTPVAEEERAGLLGEVPARGLSPEGAEELTPFPLGEPGSAEAPVPGEAVLATDLAPADEMVEGRYPSRPLTEAELAILDELDRLAGGAPADPTIVKPAQAMAAMIRLLIRKRIINEQDFLDELQRK